MKSANIWLTLILASAFGAGGVAHAAAPVCKTIANQLRAKVEANWRAGKADAFARLLPDEPGRPGGLLATQAPLFTLDENARDAFAARARSLAKPFEPAAKLLDDIGRLGAEGVTVFHFPDSSLYAANSVAGTANCNATTFFEVEDGHATLVASPGAWENNAGFGCGVTRLFASFEGKPVVVDDGSSAEPNMEMTLTLTPRPRDAWENTCTATFRFAPSFGDQPLANDWAKLNNWPKNTCGGAACEGLQKAARHIAVLAQADYRHAESRLTKAMSAAQRAAWARMKETADARDLPGLNRNLRDKDLTGPESLTDASPIVLPLLADGKMYAASVGHFSVGWRIYSDWSVSVSRIEGAGVGHIANFAIGMTKGGIIGFKVE